MGTLKLAGGIALSVASVCLVASGTLAQGLRKTPGKAQKETGAIELHVLERVYEADRFGFVRPLKVADARAYLEEKRRAEKAAQASVTRWWRFAGKRVTDEMLERFAAEHAEDPVEGLDLSGSEGWTKRGLAALARMPRLRWLDLTGCKDLRRSDLAELSASDSLRWVHYARSGARAERALPLAVGQKGRNQVLDQRVLQAIARQHLVGLSMAVIVGARIVHSRGFGYADRKRQIPADTRSMYRWASISKPVTAVAAMLLAERGKLDLAADVRTYVPEFPKKRFPVSMAQLLSHQGGIVHYRNGKVIRTKRRYETKHPFADAILALDLFKDSPLIAEPGTRYSYSTHGFMLAGAVVQRAGGVRFAKFVKEEVAVPLHMDGFQPDYQWVKIPRRVKGYVRRGKLEAGNSTNTDVSWKLPGGGYISDVHALARFGIGMLEGRILKPSSFEAMWSPKSTKDGRKTRYGYGWVIRKKPGLRVSHSGAQEKTRTMLLLAPRQHAGIALMCNTEGAQLSGLANSLLALALEGTAAAKAEASKGKAAKRK